jgi:peptide/nickel transport system permease protein
MIKPVFYLSDILFYILIVTGCVFFGMCRTRSHLRAPWQQFSRSRSGVITATILGFYIIIALLDSIHFRMQLPEVQPQQQKFYSSNIESVLDKMISPLNTESEKSYSAPFSLHLLARQIVLTSDNQLMDVYPRLLYAGQDLHRLNRSKAQDVFIRCSLGILEGIVVWSILFYLIKINRWFFSKKLKVYSSRMLWNFLMTALILFIMTGVLYQLSREYHIFGTDKVGQDVFYQAVKSIRTGVLIGTITTLIMLPFATLLGIMAGYFGGIIDDIIQYIYTTLSSIPGVLLIATCILSLQIVFESHPLWFNSMGERADVRLMMLCVVLGVTSWTGLCRLLRGESLKIREMDYIQAAQGLGSSHFNIIVRHILPNVFHIIVITVILDFSGLVLAEAVLSYLGVGVDPTMFSWGNMINSARLELAREPLVWWPLLSAFIFMFTLVLAANLFGDAVRDAYDPRIRQQLKTARKNSQAVA